jgi:CIC family chloride channel protein
VLVGAAAGVGAVVLRSMILASTALFAGQGEQAPLGLPGGWFVVLAPLVGGLLYGALVHGFARDAGGYRVPDVMLAVAREGGRMPPRTAVVHALASALCMGSGGSLGREEPILHTGAALGSTLGRVLGLPAARLRLLVACGAAGGLAATFGAPLAGVLFAAEVILPGVELGALGLLVIAAFAASLVGRAAFGSASFVTLPAFQTVSATEYVFYAALGVLAAVVAVTFIRVLESMRGLADDVWPGPEWLRPAAGGVALAVVLLAVPAMYGAGYGVLERALHGDYLLVVVAVLLLAKIVATSLTVAIGGCGGVLGPLLFIGGMLGMVVGRAAAIVLPSVTGPAGGYGLVGMAAVLGAAAGAPMTAVVLLFELSGDSRIIPPLIVATAVASVVASSLTGLTVYTLGLRRRGIEIATIAAGPLAGLRVADAMQPCEVVAVRRPDAMPAVPDVRVEHRVHLPRVLRELMHRVQGTPRNAPVDSPAVAADLPLESAIQMLSESGRARLPVVDDRNTVIGWLTQRDVLKACTASVSAGRAEGRVEPDRAAPARGGLRLPHGGPATPGGRSGGDPGSDRAG